MKSILLKAFIIGFVAVAFSTAMVIYSVNHYRLQSPMNEVLSEDYRNAGIDVAVHYKDYVYTSVLVYDLRSISNANSKADVFRVLLQFAEKMRLRGFQDVELAYHGETKFILNGAHFQKIGREYLMENRVYTMRTFPQNLKNPNGVWAYSEWSGSFLDVTMRQLQEFDDFVGKWYSN